MKKEGILMCATNSIITSRTFNHTYANTIKSYIITLLTEFVHFRNGPQIYFISYALDSLGNIARLIWIDSNVVSLLMLSI